MLLGALVADAMAEHMARGVVIDCCSLWAGVWSLPA